MATTEVLHEPEAGDDDLGGAVGAQPARGTQSVFEPAVVGLDAQRTCEEPARSCAVTTLRRQHVDDLPVLVDGAIDVAAKIAVLRGDAGTYTCSATNDLIRQLGPPAWEATMTVVEPQQQRKRDARRDALACDPVVLGIQQSPALNQLVELDRPIDGWPCFRPRRFDLKGGRLPLVTRFLPTHLQACRPKAHALSGGSTVRFG